MDKQLPKPIRQALAKAGLGKLEYGYLTKTKKFHVRVLRAEKSILEPDEQRWIVQFGYRPTFDRWANSANFQTEIWYSPTHKEVNNSGEIITKRNRRKYTIPDFKKELAWCEKVAKSGLFDLNSYFAVIKTPWFINGK